ncbi:MAG TPA: DUF2892 domain-containing protein [Mariprofundaceae bacterium]|nr:DUF2892 domain-containing protein [Mariprofundaceae bacterium]
MKANVGTIDRVIRALAGAALLAFGILGGLASPWNFVAMGVGAVLLLTAIIGFCPPYALLGINTCGKNET